MDIAYFVSDLHLDSPGSGNYLRFLKFLEDCTTHTPARMFWVGDVFDLWIADRPYFIDRHVRLIEITRKLIAAGWQLFYFEGNHDLDLQPFWGDQLNAKTYSGPAYFELAGRTIRVEHGDQMDPSDRGYIFLRWFLRTPAMRWAGRHLPNRFVKALGVRASQASRFYTTSRIKVDQVPIECAHIERVRRQKHFDDFVCGHTHNRDTFELPGGGQAFNLGTWMTEPKVLVLSGDGKWRWVNP